MELNTGKLSNYIGQIKDKDVEKADSYLVNLDKDLQNLWRISNYTSPLIGSAKVVLASGATIGFSYMPTVATHPTATPTAYTGKVAFVYSTSNNNLYIFNSGWKKVALA